MGLDVYLKRYENFDRAQRLEREYNDYSETLWNEAYEKFAKGKESNEAYDAVPDSEKELIRAKTKVWCEQHNVGDYGEANDVTSIEDNSTKYPNHMFKIGYFRSSYNSGGVNNVLGNLIDVSLGDLFNVDKSEPDFQPDWQTAMGNAKAAIKAFDKAVQTGAYRCFDVSWNEFGGLPSNNHPIQSKADAQKCYFDTIKTYLDSPGIKPNQKAFLSKVNELTVQVLEVPQPTHNTLISDKQDAIKEAKRTINKSSPYDTTFIPNPEAKFVAFITGVKYYVSYNRYMPCTYAIVYNEFGLEWPKLETESETGHWGYSFSNKDGHFYLDSPLEVAALVPGWRKRFFVQESLPCTYVVYKDEDNLNWYRQALEIVVETCEWVLAQPDKDKYFLHWSG